MGKVTILQSGRSRHQQLPEVEKADEQTQEPINGIMVFQLARPMRSGTSAPELPL